MTSSLGRSFYKTSKSYRMFTVLNYNYVIFPATLAVVFYLLYQLVHFTEYQVIVVAKNYQGWNFAAKIHFLTNLFCLLGQLPPYASIFGLCLPMKPFAYARSPKRRSFQTLRICLVTKGTNFQTVLNSTKPWYMLKNHPRLQFHILADGHGDNFRRALPSFIEINTVPESFQPQKATYKARALEYFRLEQNLSKDDWVLHLDEESEIDEFVIKTCLDFIERGDDDIGMGTIYYNCANHWKSTFLSVAEVMRIAEDFGRFQLPVRLFRRPLLGWMHGSWILINGEVENSVTWDTACMAEDFWFAYNAASMGYKFGWLHAIVHEQPPETMQDFFKQRRRWYTGILSINSYLVRLALVSSIMGPVAFFAYPAYAIFGWHLVFPQSVFLWLLWNYAADVHVLIVSSIMQDMNSSNISWISTVVNALKTILVSPFVHLIQSAALISCIFVPAKGFHVINKC